MKVTLTIPIDDYNNILTALYVERDRAREENNKKNLAHLERTIEAVQKNMYPANVMEVE
jgi:hypothetical protein